MAKVFVSQDNGFNYGPAEKFGEIVFLSWKEITQFANSPQNAVTVHNIRKVVAEDYHVGVDFLLPTGSSVSAAFMFAEAFKKKGQHRMLKWDTRAGDYYVFVVPNS